MGTHEKFKTIENALFLITSKFEKTLTLILLRIMI